MRVTRRLLPAALTLVLVSVAVIAGCSNNSKNPTSPGGGGATNTPFDSGNLSAPGSYTRTFPVAGSVGYHCSIHQSMGMVGTVVVSSSATDSLVEVTASGTSFTPATVTVKVGGRVHWSITGGTHTVTSN